MASITNYVSLKIDPTVSMHIALNLLLRSPFCRHRLHLPCPSCWRHRGQSPRRYNHRRSSKEKRRQVSKQCLHLRAHLQKYVLFLQKSTMWMDVRLMLFCILLVKLVARTACIILNVNFAFDFQWYSIIVHSEQSTSRQT